jgi:HPr kinase/phosphorylase
MPFNSQPPIPKKDKITIEYLVNQLKEKLNVDLEACNSSVSCKRRYVTEAELHRPGLALSGFVELFTYKRIQILGNTEKHYLNSLSLVEQKKAFQNLIQFDVPVIFLTDSNELSDDLIELATEVHIPIFRTSFNTTRFMLLIRDFLEDQFALQTIVHGSMVDVYGIGILIAGKSGIGKSEVALDLVERGHRLVGDDIVILTKKNNVLMASATEMNKHFMEIRGLGIIDVISMFGIRAIRYQKRLEVIVELCLWEESDDIDRTGLDRKNASILNVDIPYILLPITPGKNITVISEVIAMNHLLSHYGYDAAKAFQEKIQKEISKKKSRAKTFQRAIEYFEGDVE